MLPNVDVLTNLKPQSKERINFKSSHICTQEAYKSMQRQ